MPDTDDRGVETGGDDSDGIANRRRPLIVASNRQPYRHEYADDPNAEGDSSEATSSASDDADGDRRIEVDCPTGGLTAGLDPVLRDSGGTWVAWGDGDADAEVTDDRDCVAVPPDEEAYTLRRLWLSDDAIEGYYYGFSNRVLWPLCHEFPNLIEDRPGDVEWYRRVNRQFARAIADHVTEDAVVWLQDYHLGLASNLLRETVPASTTIGQFWHIPWPSPSVFDACPIAEELLEGLLGNDVLGFHVSEYRDAFLQCVDRYLPESKVRRDAGRVTFDGRETTVVAEPMGIDADAYQEMSRERDGARWDAFRREYDVPEGVRLGLGLDRLDYSKGILERLAAVERLFERRPDLRGEFTLVQKATPSRTNIDAYEEYGDAVRDEVDRINARFGTRQWRPIVYTEDVLPREDLCALYRRADVMIVSPLVDGMNLVAQEYVASCVDGDGALVLSRRAGATELLGDWTYTIEPRRTDRFARTIGTALGAARHERRRRMYELRRRVFEHDLNAWMRTQFAALDRVHEQRSRSKTDRERSPSI